MEAKINIDPHAFDDRIIEICNRLVDTRFKGIFAERTMKNQNTIRKIILPLFIPGVSAAAPARARAAMSKTAIRLLGPT